MNVTRLVPRTPGGWLTAFLLTVVLLVAAYQVGNSHSYVSEAVARVRETGSGPSAALTNLGNVDHLKDAFNQDAGRPRLILLLSLT